MSKYSKEFNLEVIEYIDYYNNKRIKWKKEWALYNTEFIPKPPNTKIKKCPIFWFSPKYYLYHISKLFFYLYHILLE